MKDDKCSFRRRVCKNRKFERKKRFTTIQKSPIQKIRRNKKICIWKKEEYSINNEITIEQEIDLVIEHVWNKNISTDLIFDWREIKKREYKSEIIHKSHTLHKTHFKARNTYKEIVKRRKWLRTKIEVYISRFVKRSETWQIRTKNPGKTIAIKYIESDEVKERFQVDLVQFSDYLHLERRYLCNYDDHLCKFACSKVINNKTK